MNYKNIIKKQSFIIGLTIFVMSVILIGTSYAIFQKVTRGETEQVIETGDLTIKYATTSTVYTDAMVPVTDHDGRTSTPYEFTVSNMGTLPMTYKITLNVNKDENNPMPIKFLKYTLDDGETRWLKDCSTTTLTIDNNGTTETIPGAFVLAENLALPKKGIAGSIVSHVVRVWIDEETPEITKDEEQIHLVGKRVNLELRVSGDVDEVNADTGE